MAEIWQQIHDDEAAILGLSYGTPPAWTCQELARRLHAEEMAQLEVGIVCYRAESILGFASLCQGSSRPEPIDLESPERPAKRLRMQSSVSASMESGGQDNN